MKLNQTELKIMCTRIVKDLKVMADREQKKLDVVNDKANTAVAKSVAAELIAANKQHAAMIKGLSKQAKVALPKSSVSTPLFTKRTVKDILIKLRVTQTLVEVPMYSDWGFQTYELYQNLVLAQIGIKDIQSLRDSVMTRYIK